MNYKLALIISTFLLNTVPIGQSPLNKTTIEETEYKNFYKCPYYLSINDFTINKSNFNDNDLLVDFIMSSPQRSGTIGIEYTLVLENGTKYDKTNVSNFSYSIFAKEFIKGPLNVRLRVSKSIFIESGIFTMRLSYNNSNASSFSFRFSPFLDKRIMLKSNKFYNYYEVSYQGNYIYERFEIMQIDGINSYYEFDFYRNIPLYNFRFNFSLKDNALYKGNCYYAVYDPNLLMTNSFSGHNMNKDKYSYFKLNRYDAIGTSFKLKTNILFLNNLTNEMFRTEKDGYEMVRSIYFPNEHIDFFSNTFHYLEFKDFGEYKVDIYFPFNVKMEKVLINQQFHLTGEYGSVLTETRFENIRV